MDWSHRRLLCIGLLVLLAGLTTTMAEIMTPERRMLESVGPVQKIIVVHRHGARTPMMNISGVCGNLGCGALLAEGIAMLKGLGRWLAEEYPTVVPDWYDPRSIRSTADTIDRTIQSAAAFVHGLFLEKPNVTVFPAIQTESQATSETFLPVSNVPTYFLHQQAIQQNRSIYFQDHLLQPPPQGYFTVSELNALVKELNYGPLSDMCSQDATLFLCTQYVADFLAVAQVVGTLDQFPLGQSLFPQVLAYHSAYRQLMEYTYDTFVLNNSFYSQVGVPGRFLAEQIFLHHAADKEGPTLIEYSGHDTTLMPLYVALGNISFGYPSFAEALVFEVADTASCGTWIRAKLGRPEINREKVVDRDVLYNYTFHPFTLMCWGENATEPSLVPGDVGCPLEDIQRYLTSRLPQNPLAEQLGGCYVDPTDLAANNCTSSSDSPLTDGSLCSMFRSLCPFSACGPRHYLSPMGVCVPLA
jgi:hypothetical protein